MKMVMIVVDEARKEELEVVLERAGVSGYTELSRASGRGTTGPRLGSRAFPGTSAVIFSILSADRLETLTATIRAFCQDCDVRPRIVAWDVEELQ